MIRLIGNIKSNILFYGLSTVYIALNSIFIYNGIYWFNLFPLVLIVAYFALYRYDYLFYFAVFFTPLSVALSYYIELPFDISIPTELLLISLLLIFIFQFLHGQRIDKKIIQHPVSLSIILYLIWMFLCSISSSMPLVSFKFWIAKLWFILPAYFFALKIFRKNSDIISVLTFYLIPLIIVIFYTITRHFEYGFYDKEAAHRVMTPFYKDHTSYGAVLSMFWFVLVGLLFWTKRLKIYKLFIFAALLILSFALVLSYSRAAWISLGIALFFGIILILKIKVRYVILTGILALIMIFLNRNQIIDRLSKNKQDSSTKFEQHLESISNIATDASNVERINRWKCALKMFIKRPVLGWGPGTYMFQYAPFQMAKDRTIISTDFGDWGNAHSEYLGALAETGLPGLLFFLMIMYFIFASGIRTFQKSVDKESKILVWISLTAIAAYLIHGFLNNFLDTDKLSIPFWIFVAIIVYQELKLKHIQ